MGLACRLAQPYWDVVSLRQRMSAWLAAPGQHDAPRHLMQRRRICREHRRRVGKTAHRRRVLVDEDEHPARVLDHDAHGEALYENVVGDAFYA